MTLGFETKNERFFVTKKPGDPDTKLMYATTKKVDVICDMHFQHFPFDSHTCKFFIESLKGQNSIRL